MMALDAYRHPIRYELLFSKNRYAKCNAGVYSRENPGMHATLRVTPGQDEEQKLNKKRNRKPVTKPRRNSRNTKAGIRPVIPPPLVATVFPCGSYQKRFT
jgi:hypothetical protein